VGKKKDEKRFDGETLQNMGKKRGAWRGKGRGGGVKRREAGDWEEASPTKKKKKTGKREVKIQKGMKTRTLTKETLHYTSGVKKGKGHVFEKGKKNGGNNQVECLLKNKKRGGCGA